MAHVLSLSLVALVQIQDAHCPEYAPSWKMFLSFQLKKLTPKHGFTVESSCDSRIKLFISQAKCHFCYKDAQLQQLHISILGYIFVITCFFHSARVEAL